MSAKRRRRDRHYQRQRDRVYQCAGGRCEAQVSEDCTRRCEQVHHINKRQGDDPHALKWLLGVCLPCHMWIEQNRREARQLGLLVSRLGKIGGYVGGAP